MSAVAAHHTSDDSSYPHVAIFCSSTVSCGAGDGDRLGALAGPVAALRVLRARRDPGARPHHGPPRGDRAAETPGSAENKGYEYQ